ncbi:MAG: type II toxin-antitoxin system RnlA family toxin [Pontibacterium sp.]
MADYKNLNLNREALDANIGKFFDERGLTADGEPGQRGSVTRYTFGQAGADFAMVDLHMNKDGTTTVNWKLGKNKSLGEELAIYLKATIDPAEFESVNYSLSGITSDAINPIFELFSESDDFENEIRQDDDRRKLVTITSVKHQDQITITHHKTKRVLQVQGKPLTCYRKLIYRLTDLLDLKGLEQVLYRKDDGSAEIVRKEMAEDYLRGSLEVSFDQIPVSVKKLLVSSCCVKLAAPDLPDYCMLLYPDLRSLEGVLKELMCEYDMELSSAENGFGDFFDRHDGNYVLKQERQERVDNSDMSDALGTGYSFYNKHRHTLFHMEDYADASRMVDTLDKAISLSKDAYAIIESLYASRQQ